MNVIAKIYDYTLNNRLMKWYQPDMEQAGSQPGRGCLNHIVTLRLLTNFAIETKRKLFILYVDFSKAYDRIPRDKLLASLQRYGIGDTMLKALASLYRTSECIIGSSTSLANAGVRQGAPSSGFLFTLYVNELIKQLKLLEDDDYLKSLHCTMLMDDTVIVASSRVKLLEKIAVLKQFCDEYGMIINADKTRFMVVNGEANDGEPIQCGDLLISNTNEYNYLGVIFTQDGKPGSALKRHTSEKQKHVMKFAQYVHKNKDHPFIAKFKVLKSAFNAAILYGIESWIDCNISLMNTTYMKGIKLALGVRESTPNDVCLTELGLPSLKAYTLERQYEFFKKAFSNPDNQEDPLQFAFRLHRQQRTKTYRYIERTMQNGKDCRAKDIQQRKEHLRTSERSKNTAYVSLNPNLTVDEAYSGTNLIPEHNRIQFSRLRCISHSLAIERGRWQRLPREDRTCRCGEVQTELHVLFDCTESEHLRVKYNVIRSMDSLLINNERYDFVSEVLAMFANNN